MQVPFSESGLKIACTRAIKTLDNEVHGMHFVDDKGNQIDKDSINKLLYAISLYDNFSQDNSTKFSNDKYELYEKTNQSDKCYKLITTGFLMENPANLPIDNPIKTGIALEDYDLYLNDKPKHISIRILNNFDIIKIIVDETKIHRLTESIPIGLEKVIHKLDSLKNEQNASR
jgi:hypothetical protein